MDRTKQGISDEWMKQLFTKWPVSWTVLGAISASIVPNFFTLTLKCALSQMFSFPRRSIVSQYCDYIIPTTV